MDSLPPQPPTNSSSVSLSVSLIIIAAIIVFVVLASFFIHLFLRFLSCRRGSSVAALPLPLDRSRSASSSAAAAAANFVPFDQEKANSLPVYSLAASPKSSPDCAVCLSPLRRHDELRLLPACRHAFHSSCVDPWLQTTPSCPLCRASVSLPASLLPALPSAVPPLSDEPDSSRLGSFRIEIGSVSRRMTPSGELSGNPSPLPAPLPSSLRTYSIGSSFEYLVDEEVEAVVARITRRTEKVEKRGDTNTSTEADAATAPPGDAVAEAAGGGPRLLKEYVDQLSSSASSSFSSLRFSNRWSHRYDGDGVRNSWDLERSAWQEVEESGLHDFFHWLMGA
ncbi:E3 ubiquitin-protein ligase ATL4-like [Musa acuminata AAA Group]|uniref:(wild Malaysian banana) hypothetical protein n=1 Tax=Musa acuminata subsp. malaccensis TaxID=214687 RepID=A0A804I1X2_MUSAM|nr:PREDICTED: E3 ubiquitin-protein ligase ATL4-like [Musa acuminata subsp. malaccensis]CAG1861815.1 unnamed protein product [Musa acuminata subsp. malaccensis]